MPKSIQTPIIFRTDQPLILRPLEPQGFTLETHDELVIFQCQERYEDVTFRIARGPVAGSAVFTFGITWMEVRA